MQGIPLLYFTGYVRRKRLPTGECVWAAAGGQALFMTGIRK